MAVQIYGSCHNRGKSTQVKGSSWPVGYRPGKALSLYYKSIAPGHKKFYTNEYSNGHHQQYLDWEKSKHADRGIDCMTCYTVHELGNPLFRSKTKLQGDKLCTSCHEQTAKVGAHVVHSFGNCVNCHMPRMNIKCVQCHRSQPIFGVHHYYSPMNPIRRHAYVCAKCHEGSTPSFAA